MKWMDSLMKKLTPVLSEKQIHEICRQMSFALEGDMSLPDALRLVAAECYRKKERVFLHNIAENVSKGFLFSEALDQSGYRYPPVWKQFILAGEKNGNLQRAIRDAELHFSEKESFRKKLLSAMLYPLVILSMAMVAFVAMFVLVVPVIQRTYEGLGVTPPPLTVAVMQVGFFIMRYGNIIIALILTCCLMGTVIWERVKLQAKLRQQMLKIIFGIPVLGRCMQQLAFVQIGGTLGMLLESGMLPADTLGAAESIYSKTLYGTELEQLHRKVSEGESFTEMLYESILLPKMARRMIAVSDQNGKTGKALMQLATYYRNQSEYTLQLFTGLLEPVCIVGLGLLVLLIGGSLFLPMVQSYQYLLV